MSIRLRRRSSRLSPVSCALNLRQTATEFERQPNFFIVAFINIVPYIRQHSLSKCFITLLPLLEIGSTLSSLFGGGSSEAESEGEKMEEERGGDGREEGQEEEGAEKTEAEETEEEGEGEGEKDGGEVEGDESEPEIEEEEVESVEEEGKK